MANGRRGSRGRGGKSGSSIISGMSAGSNSDLVSQSGGIASSFQSTNGSGKGKYGPGSTGSRRPRGSSNIFGNSVAIFGAAGDGAPVRSGGKSPTAATLRVAGNNGATNVSIVRPKALPPKGFGGNYKLSKGY